MRRANIEFLVISVSDQWNLVVVSGLSMVEQSFLYTYKLYRNISGPTESYDSDPSCSSRLENGTL